MAHLDAQQSAALPVAFNRFIELMNQDAAKDLVRMINTFMKDFKHRPSNPEVDSQAVQAFLQQMETAMAKHPLFANSTPIEQDAATEALEKYLMTKLFERTFRQSVDDVERDDILALRCAALQFVAPEHLEIPEGVVDDHALDRAVVELNRINQYKAPRDKLVCVLNCCRMLTSMLTSRSKADGIGADDFTPLLIFLVIRAQTPQLASNLAYIERYRYHAKLTSETQYYYIQLCGAATFIEMVNATSLKVDRDEFIAHMLAAGAMSDEQLFMMQSASSTDGTSSPLHPAKNSISRSTAQAAAQAAAAGIPTQQHQQQQQQQATVQVAVPPPPPPPSHWYENGQQQQPLQMQALPAAAAAAGSSDYYGQQRQYYQATLFQQQQHQHPYPQQHQVHQPQHVYQQYHHPQQQQQQIHQHYQQQQYQQHYQQQQYQQQHQAEFTRPLPPIPDLEAQGSVLLASRGAAGISRHLASKHPFSCSTLDSLSLGDVERLLLAYKELVLRHEALLAALEQIQQQQQLLVPAARSDAAVPPPPPPPPVAMPQGAAAAAMIPPPPPAAAASISIPPPPPPVDHAPAAAAAAAAAEEQPPVAAAAVPPPPPAAVTTAAERETPAAAAAAWKEKQLPHAALGPAALPAQELVVPAAAAGQPITDQTQAADSRDAGNAGSGAERVGESAVGESARHAAGSADAVELGIATQTAELQQQDVDYHLQQQQQQEDASESRFASQQQQEQVSAEVLHQQEAAAVAVGNDTAAAAATPVVSAEQKQQQQQQQQQQSDVDELLHTLLDGEVDELSPAAGKSQQQQQHAVNGTQQQQQQQSPHSADDLFGGLIVSDSTAGPSHNAAATAAGAADDEDDMFGLFQGPGDAGHEAGSAAFDGDGQTATAASLLD